MLLKDCAKGAIGERIDMKTEEKRLRDRQVQKVEGRKASALNIFFSVYTNLKQAQNYMKKDGHFISKRGHKGTASKKEIVLD